MGITENLGIKKKTLLIVDDNKLSRMILEKILNRDYILLQAENGQQAYEILERDDGNIEGILLDVIMPVMNGFEFLIKINQNKTYQNIPIIVTTGTSEREAERRALELGAWDFVPKPYDAKIVSYRVKNVIARSQIEAFEKLKYLAEFDELTGIYNKTNFFDSTQFMLYTHPNDQFVFVRIDVTRFKLINSYYGLSKGDRLLQFIADNIRDFVRGKHLITYGRIRADVFALCFIYEGDEKLKHCLDSFTNCFKTYPLGFDIVPNYGVYLIDEPQIPVNTMYDRATLAAESVKGNYLRNSAYYDSNMEAAIKREQEIAGQMGNALLEGQFIVYIQPKYNLQTDTPCGGEALVRWLHPTKGLVSPGLFIPVLEKNGFVSQLDYYMWEKVCALLRKWMLAGKNPCPVSVNVSRIDIYNSRLVEILCGITAKYQVPRNLLQLELTESAYTDNVELISDTINRLRQKGFTVLMDDFGSGYSSLNVLKDVVVDILKIDMRFFGYTDESGRSESIIAAVVRMAKWLGIPVVAEGVEKKQQVEFLRSIGCEYVQGFYFAKPMPVDEYEMLANEAEAAKEESPGLFSAATIWSSCPLMEKHFLDVSKPMAIYEYGNRGVQLLRVNGAYHAMFDYQSTAVREDDAFGIVEKIHHERILNLFETCAETKGEEECACLRRKDGKEECWIRILLRYVTSVGNQLIFLGELSEQKSEKPGGKEHLDGQLI